MKKIVLIVFCIILVCFATLAFATPTSGWFASLGVSNTSSYSNSAFTFGTSASPGTASAPYPSVNSPFIGEPNDSFYWSKDIRLPLSAGESYVWNVILFGGNVFSPITLSGGSSTLQDFDASLWLGETMLWDIDEYPNFSITLPYTSSAAPYELQIRATALPEPGSMCGLLAGLMGMGTYLYRRRR